MDMQQKEDKIISFLRSHLKDKHAVLGMSGGIDSSLVAALLNRGLPKEKIHALILPSFSNHDEDAVLAASFAQKLGISYEKINIQPLVDAFRNDAAYIQREYAIGNLKARIRMSLLYAKANEIGGMVIGTGNKTELMIGYFTKYGDGGVDILPIGDLYKKEVRTLAAHLNVPQAIIDKTPTAGLWSGQTDEEEIGMSYETLDAILIALEKNESTASFEDMLVVKVKKLMQESAHKRQPLPICQI